jgi:hypothetical protein
MLTVTVETMSLRLRVTLRCKADALEMRDSYRISADRCTSKRVKHWIETRRRSTSQETLLPILAAVGTPFIVQKGGGEIPKHP